MLQGTLENFALDEVLNLLSGTSKTGKLEIAGNRGTGALAFHDGRIADALASNTANGTSLEDVMFELLRFSEGTFSFETGDVEAGDSPESVASVLSAAEGRLGDWRSIEAIVPSLQHEVTPAPELPAEEITIDRNEWAALRAIASGCPASAVCDKLHLGEVEGSRRIKGLAERNLVTISEPIAAKHSTSSARVPAPSPSLPTTPAPNRGDSSQTLTSADVLQSDELGSGSALPPIGFDKNTLDPLGTGSSIESMGLDSSASRPPMPPAPDFDEFTEIGDIPPAPPSPAEISSFGEDLEDASELADDEDAKGGGLLARYLNTND